MASNGISSKVVTAASVPLAKPVQVFGVNTYTISTDFISWGEGNNYTLQDIAPEFGTRTTGVGDKVFVCGDDRISVYDFGLLFSVFTAMTSAQAELGSNFPIAASQVSREGLHSLWLGNDMLLYSQAHNLIVQLDNAQVQQVCAGSKVECTNFCTKDRYIIDRERVELFVVEASKHELLCRTRISDSAQHSYAKWFQDRDDNKDVTAPWDTESRLGRLIAAVNNKLPVKKMMDAYHKKGILESAGVRRELIVSPGECIGEVTSVASLLGKAYYTNKADVIIAVNYRAGMLVYTPYFGGEQADGVQVDSKCQLSELCEVTSGCDAIARYANTVVNRPLTPAQFDAKVFGAVANAWMEQRLKRVSFGSSLGRVVVPESTFEETLDVGFGADLFCMVPVGLVGDAVVCKTAQGTLELKYQTGWDINEAFYDITEVVTGA